MVIRPFRVAIGLVVAGAAITGMALQVASGVSHPAKDGRVGTTQGSNPTPQASSSSDCDPALPYWEPSSCRHP
jgi:hypothetical protein